MMVTTSILVALLPALALTQSAPQNTTIFGGYPSDQYALEYYDASQRTNVTNAVPFRGFNWSSELGPSFPTGVTNSSDTWYLRVNYSRVDVPTPNGNASTALTVLSLDFPEEQWGSDSDWALCTSVTSIVNSVTDGKGNNSDPLCAPYLGESCTNALVEAYRNAHISNSGTGCPSLPALSTIDECKSVANDFTGGGGAAITNTTSPDLIYSSANSSYINVTTGAVSGYNLGNATYQGLSSGQAFAGWLDVLPNTNVPAESIEDSKTIRVAALSIVPSLAFRLNSSGGYGWESNVRLMCARANTTSAAAFGAAGSVPVAALSAGLAIVMFVGLW